MQPLTPSAFRTERRTLAYWVCRWFHDYHVWPRLIDGQTNQQCRDCGRLYPFDLKEWRLIQ